MKLNCFKKGDDVKEDLINFASYLDFDIYVLIMRGIAFMIWFYFMKCMAEYIKSLPTEHMQRS